MTGITTMRATFCILIAVIGLTGAAAPVGAASDTWITMKAKMALIETDDVDAMDINVDTINGVVTLHGKVDSAGERERAEKVVAKLDGVKQVRNLLQIVSDSKKEVVEKTDDRIKDDVKQALASAAFHADSSIDIASVNNGVVLLKGKAKTMSDHLRALEVASGVPGVRQVASDIKSPDTLADADIWTTPRTTAQGATATSGTGDLWMTTETKMRLMSDERIPALEINVDTRDGVVTLFGYVYTDEAKAAAEEIASKVDGVRRVDNALEVVPEGEKAAVAERDEDVDRMVEQVLKTDPLLKDDRIDVEVKNGIARLTGMVDSEGERYAAAGTARSVRGVRAIKNDLTVEGAVSSN